MHRLTSTHVNITKKEIIFFSKDYLINRGAHRTLKHHLKHLWVSGFLMGGEGQFQCFLLHVLNRHLHGHQNDLQHV